MTDIRVVFLRTVDPETERRVLLGTLRLRLTKTGTDKVIGKHVSVR